MKFLNNNVKTKSSIKYLVSTKILPKAVAILFSLIIITLLTTSLLIKKNMIITIKSTPKEIFKNIDLSVNLELDRIKETIFNAKFTNTTNNKKLLSLTTNKNSDSLTFINNKYSREYKKINIDNSPILSFMSRLEIFYSISLLVILSVIISALIIALLYRPVINLLTSLDILSIFSKNKTDNSLNNTIHISSEDEITKDF